MVKLSEIEAAYKDRDYTKGDYLSHQWYCERGITVHHGDTPQSVMMRYIERLEAELLSFVMAWENEGNDPNAAAYEDTVARANKLLNRQHEREEAR